MLKSSNPKYRLAASILSSGNSAIPDGTAVSAVIVPAPTDLAANTRVSSA